MLVTTYEIDFLAAPTSGLGFLTELTQHLESIRPQDVITRRSAAIMDHMMSLTTSEGRVSSKQNILDGAVGRQSANSRLDFIFNSNSLNYQIPIEVAFNNREAIGTNFLKLEAFGRHLGLNQDCPFGILIAPTRSLLEFGGWDSAYADNLEYQSLRNSTYKPILSLPAVIVELHGVF